MAESRQCPTRVDGGDPLIAHSITLPTCSKRQREHYHKCYSCVHSGTSGADPKKRGKRKRPTIESVPVAPRSKPLAPVEPVQVGAEGAA